MKLLSTLVTSILAGTADYSVQGDNWQGQCNLGEHQSPINIQTTYCSEEPDLDPFRTHGYYNLVDWEVAYQNGLKFTPKSDQIKVSGGQLNTHTGREEGAWKLAQFHLHWGGMATGRNGLENYQMGSEHTLDGRHYFSEVHFVHYNAKYSGLGEAADKSDGLAVLGYFIDVSEDETNSALDDLLQKATGNVFERRTEENEAQDHARRRRGGDSEWKNIVRGAPADFVDENFQHYYRYDGSLTTPGCFESVQWTVFDSPLTVNKKTMKMMTSMSTGTDFENNWRHTMPLNNRAVTFYHPNPLVRYGSGAETLTCAALALLVGQL